MAKKKPPVKPVNINTATSEELRQVPGIGPATAQKILQMRKSYGPFKNVDDLLAIRGLGQKRLDKKRKYLTVGVVAQPKKPPNPGQNPSISESNLPMLLNLQAVYHHLIRENSEVALTLSATPKGLVEIA